MCVGMCDLGGVGRLRRATADRRLFSPSLYAVFFFFKCLATSFVAGGSNQFKSGRRERERESKSAM